jgi:hypothetical protein
MSRTKLYPSAITLPRLSKLLGVPERTLYRWNDARGAIPLIEAIWALERELQTLYTDAPRARKIRRYEDALKELRVERALHLIQNRRARQGRRRGAGHLAHQAAL